jgi:hypothetical protein
MWDGCGPSRLSGEHLVRRSFGFLVEIVPPVADEVHGCRGIAPRIRPVSTVH